MKSVTVTMQQDLRALSNPSPWLTLLQIRFPDGTGRNIVPNPEAVVFDGVTYYPFACQVGESSTDLSGGLAEVEVQIQNITREMSALVEVKELRGTSVRVITINAARLSDPAGAVEDLSYQVNEYQLTEQFCIVRLGHDQLLKQRAPYGRIRRDNCRWVYNYPPGRSLECGAPQWIPHIAVVNSSGVSVTSADPNFTKSILVGDLIKADIAPSQTRTVASIVSDTELTTDTAFSPALVARNYWISKATCSKTLEGPNGCRAHGNVARIGAFPGVPVVLGG